MCVTWTIGQGERTERNVTLSNNPQILLLSLGPWSWPHSVPDLMLGPLAGACGSAWPVTSAEWSSR
jgi:hypothetical protein